MSVARKTIDNRAYARLLSRLLPQPIRTDEELDRMTAELLRLDELEELGTASPAERKLAELLTVLMERYEDEHYPITPDAPPHERLAACMEHRGLSQSDIAKIIGSRSLASEILSGKREISKAAVKKLARRLRCRLPDSRPTSPR